MVGAQERKGRGKDGRRLVHFVFKMAECSMVDDYAIFKMKHRPVRLTNFEGKVVFLHPVCQGEAVFLQLNGLQHHYRARVKNAVRMRVFPASGANLPLKLYAITKQTRFLPRNSKK